MTVGELPKGDVVTARKHPAMPAQVRVGPLVYDVACDSLALLVAEHSHKQALLGQCDHKALAIMLSPDQAPLALKSTLLHEVLHAVINTAGFEITDEDEERLVSVLEAPLLQLVRDNPDLIAWLSDQ